MFDKLHNGNTEALPLIRKEISLTPCSAKLVLSLRSEWDGCRSVGPTTTGFPAVKEHGQAVQLFCEVKWVLGLDLFVFICIKHDWKHKGLHRLSGFKTSLWNLSYMGAVGWLILSGCHESDSKCVTPNVVINLLSCLQKKKEKKNETYMIGWHDCISAVIWSIRALPFKMAGGRSAGVCVLGV